MINSVCVLGGSGFIGQRVIDLLSRAGLEVRVPTRDRERAKEKLILLPTVDVRTADVHDPAQLAASLSGVDAVINLIGVLHDLPKGSFQRNHIELPRRLVENCQRQGIRRLLHMSALNASVTGPSAYLRSKGAGETIVNSAPWLDVTVFRPSVVFGAGDRFLTLFAKLARLSPVIPLAHAEARFQPVYVEDVARVIADSLTNVQCHGLTFDLCGPKVYTLRDLVRYAASHSSANPTIIPLPRIVARMQAAVMEHLPGRLLTRDNLDSMSVDSVCRCEFPSLFGFAPTPLDAVAHRFLGDTMLGSRYRQFRFRARR